MFEALGHIATDDTLGKSLDNSCFSHTRLTYEHRIIFGTTAKHLYTAANFIDASDNRIELMLACEFTDVAAELL